MSKQNQLFSEKHSRTGAKISGTSSGVSASHPCPAFYLGEDMKWFKHFSKAKFDTKLWRIIQKHGLRGYGLYFAIVEGIAFNLEPEKPCPELEETDQDIAKFFGEDTVKIEEIVHDLIKEGLISINEHTKKIQCLKLLTHLDNTLSQNKTIIAIIDNFNKLNDDKLKETLSPLKQIRLDKIRLDKSNKEYIDKWNTFPCLQNCHKYPKKLDGTLKDYPFTKEQILQAITNYGEVIGHPEKYFFNYRWSIMDFIFRGKNERQAVAQFIDDAKPLENFLKDKDKAISKPFDPLAAIPGVQSSHEEAVEAQKRIRKEMGIA